MPQNFTEQRQQLIGTLRKSGIRDQRVLAALADIPREAFIDEKFHNLAYDDRALPLDLGQTISQPLMVALMTQALRLTGQERVLEIGTGSGYQTAILARLVAHITSVERYPQLAWQAAHHLATLGVKNVSLYVGDGSQGWSEGAPYQRILVAAGAPEIPARLLSQLALWGILVIPVGRQERQDLQVVQRVPWGDAHPIAGKLRLCAPYR